MSKHTKEPWSISNYRDSAIQAYGTCDTVSSSVLGTIVDCGPTEQVDNKGRVWKAFEGTPEENAKRIVDCVNALEGIDNPAEYIAALKAENERLREEVERLRPKMPCEEPPEPQPLFGMIPTDDERAEFNAIMALGGNPYTELYPKMKAARQALSEEKE